MAQSKKLQVFIRELIVDFRWTQVFAIGCLMVLSVLFVYSATYQSSGQIPKEVTKQLRWFAIGSACYLFVALIDYHWLCRKAIFLYLIVLGMLAYVLQYGQKVNGARRWINMGSMTIQPSEFAKLSVLLGLCYFLSRCAGTLGDWRKLSFASVMALVPVILIHRQPDLGTAIVVAALFLMLLFLAGAPMRFFALLGIMGVLVVGVLSYETHRYIVFRQERVAGLHPKNKEFKSYLHLHEYQLNRIVGVVKPEELSDLDEGWNSKQSLVAIGNGQLYGKGWNKGEVTHGGYLPRMGALNDFIFAVFAEETGFAGGLTLVSLYALLLFGGVKIALKARDLLGMLLASGATFLIFFHVFVNMGMTMRILPVVGVPLPLVSYGGSFVLVCMVSLGLLQSVWLHRKPY